MFTLVSHSHYQNEAMYCPTCGWQGHGYQLKESEEIELLHIREVYCPHCNRYMGQYSTTNNLLEGSRDRETSNVKRERGSQDPSYLK